MPKDAAKGDERALARQKNAEYDDLDERKLHILHTIIDHYILTATPVGSRAISKHEGIGVSSATIRNEMSDLEEMGYLEQPHTSAGRIPSEKAYRLYVDRLMQLRPLSQVDQTMIHKRIGEHLDGLEELTGHAAKVLSELTKLPSIVKVPELDDITIRHVQIVPVSIGRALAVIVTEAATVHDAMMQVPESFGTSELERASHILTARLEGFTLREAICVLEDEMQGEFANYRHISSQLGNRLDESMRKKKKGQIVLGGTANLFMYPEFSDVRSAQHMLSVFETEETLYQLLEKAEPMTLTIRIGSENSIVEMQGSSVVTASYQIGGTTGSFGVIGPTRMDYAHIAAVMKTMADSLSRIFAASAEGEVQENSNPSLGDG